MLSRKLDEIVWTNTVVKLGRVDAWHGFASLAKLAPRGQRAEPCQQFDVCGYGELQVLHRKAIDIGRLQCQNASTALKFDKQTLCQQAKADCHSLA